MRLIFATNNKHKLSEIRDILGDNYKDFVFTPGDFGVSTNPDENGKTFTENATIKAMALYEVLKNKNLLEKDDYIIADDTGLCIDYLDGAPGIMSARYMGENTSQEEKNLKILDIMKDLTDDKRTAYFITVLAVVWIKEGSAKPEVLAFEGRIDGYIAKKIEKTEGFGYDPIFAVGNTGDLATGNVKTYSNIGTSNKNKISHRARAISAFVQYLEKSHNI